MGVRQDANADKSFITIETGRQTQNVRQCRGQKQPIGQAIGKWA